MGRLSREHVELTTKRVFSFLLERESCVARLVAVTKITESLMKTRSSNGVRKKNYRDQLDNAHKVLCSLATDSEEYKQKYIKMKDKNDNLSHKNANLSDENVKLLHKLSKFEQCKALCKTHEQARTKAEEDCETFMKENKLLKDEISRLQKK